MLGEIVNVLHANGFHMAVTIEPIAEAIARIGPPGSEISSVRRMAGGA